MDSSVMSKDYSHKDIKVLEEMEHIQQNPALYIGEPKNPNHLLYEVLDNSLDEALAGHADLIGVQIDSKKETITIADNGRGIPWQNNTIETIATKLYSGGKFEKGKGSNSYKIATGLHGIGVVAVTALSDFLEIMVYRDKKKVTCRFENAKLVDKKIENHKEAKSPFSTQAEFKPSKKYFETIIPLSKEIISRLRVATSHLPKLQILFIIDGISQVINCNEEELFRKEIADYKIIKTSPVKVLSNKIDDEEIKIRFCWEFGGSTASKVFGCVNMLPVHQGTYINRSFDIFRDTIHTLAVKEKMKFTKQDCLISFRAYVSIMLYKPAYDSQTKDRLTNPKKLLDGLFNPLHDKFKEMLKDAEYKNSLFSFFETYRNKLNRTGKVIKSGAKVSRLNMSLDSNLRDCITHDVGSSELFILEGQSAGGSLVQCRNPQIHAILGLKGKIPNVADNKKDFLKNKEIVDMINALGTGIDSDFDVNGLRYGKIIFATDADSDGAHISVLLMVAFMIIVPDLLKSGYVYRAELPLYGSQIKKIFYPLYNEQEVETFKKTHVNAHITRYKGLGEMNPDQLKVCLLDVNKRKLTKINFPTNQKEIMDCNDIIRRKEKTGMMLFEKQTLYDAKIKYITDGKSCDLQLFIMAPNLTQLTRYTKQYMEDNYRNVFDIEMVEAVIVDSDIVVCTTDE